MSLEPRAAPVSVSVGAPGRWSRRRSDAAAAGTPLREGAGASGPVGVGVGPGSRCEAGGGKGRLTGRRRFGFVWRELASSGIRDAEEKARRDRQGRGLTTLEVAEDARPGGGAAEAGRTRVPTVGREPQLWGDFLQADTCSRKGFAIGVPIPKLVFSRGLQSQRRRACLSQTRLPPSGGPGNGFPGRIAILGPAGGDPKRLHI